MQRFCAPLRAGDRLLGCMNRIDFHPCISMPTATGGVYSPTYKSKHTPAILDGESYTSSNLSIKWVISTWIQGVDALQHSMEPYSTEPVTLIEEVFPRIQIHTTPCLVEDYYPLWIRLRELFAQNCAS